MCEIDLCHAPTIFIIIIHGLLKAFNLVAMGETTLNLQTFEVRIVPEMPLAITGMSCYEVTHFNNK